MADIENTPDDEFREEQRRRRAIVAKALRKIVFLEENDGTEFDDLVMDPIMNSSPETKAIAQKHTEETLRKTQEMHRIIDLLEKDKASVLVEVSDGSFYITVHSE